jgi:hypothetical protein
MRAFAIVAVLGLGLVGCLPLWADWQVGPAAVTSGGGESTGPSLSVIGSIGQAVAADSLAGEPGLVGRSGLWSQLLAWINTPPIPGADHSLRRSGDGTQIQISRLLSNDVDPDRDPLTFAGFESISAAGGQVHREGPWLFYEPPTTADPEQDLVLYLVSDGVGPAVFGQWVITRGTVDPSGPPNALGLTLDPSDPSRIRVRFQGIIGRTYGVQRASRIDGPWEFVGSVAGGLNGAMEFLDTAVPETRFYRLVEP